MPHWALRRTSDGAFRTGSPNWAADYKKWTRNVNYAKFWPARASVLKSTSAMHEEENARPWEPFQIWIERKE